ncbi:MAG TPA: DUF1634 domain-containing protein [Candidatus Binatus sp.]|nr:DUF1634 domain-containing protein [Candidatus Binatus sp.]
MTSRIDLYKAIGGSLRVGVLLAWILCAIGLVVWGLAGYPVQRLISGSNVFDVFALASKGDFTGLIYLGILVLIATPVFRVIVSAFGFSLERDWKYLLISLVVLAMLLFGIFSGSVA